MGMENTPRENMCYMNAPLFGLFTAAPRLRDIVLGAAARRKAPLSAEREAARRLLADMAARVQAGHLIPLDEVKVRTSSRSASTRARVEPGRPVTARSAPPPRQGVRSRLRELGWQPEDEERKQQDSCDFFRFLVTALEARVPRAAGPRRGVRRARASPRAGAALLFARAQDAAQQQARRH